MLLTPGPLTTAQATRDAMAVDLGSRDPEFTAVTDRIREGLVRLIDGEGEFSAIPLQGSGTFSVEAMIGTLVPPESSLLVLVNGAYGRRMVDLAKTMGRGVAAMTWDEVQPVDPEAVDNVLAEHPAFSHVAIVHCETTTGLRNPIAEIAEVVERHGRELLIDSMSALGALPLSSKVIRFQAVVSSANKCLEGVPGFGFALVRNDALAETWSHSVSLDLGAQHARFERDGQWRYTPPTHALLAFDAALQSFFAEGGQPARLDRYSKNCDALIDGMHARGFATVLPDELQAPIIVTFEVPDHPAWDFARFYDALIQRGFAIYPGKLTERETFRVGCIGQVYEADIARFLTAVDEALAELGVQLEKSE